MIKSLKALNNFECLAQNLQFISLRSFHVNDELAQLSQYPEIFIEYVIFNY